MASNTDSQVDNTKEPETATSQMSGVALSQTTDDEPTNDPLSVPSKASQRSSATTVSEAKGDLPKGEKKRRNSTKRGSIQSDRSDRRGSTGQGRRKNSAKPGQDRRRSSLKDDPTKVKKITAENKSNHELSRDSQQGQQELKSETPSATFAAPSGSAPRETATAVSALTMTTSAADTEFDNDDEDVGTDPFKIPDDHSFENLEEIYSGVLQGLTSVEQEGVNISMITDEFTRLWEGIERSHENEIHLISADREISVKLSAAMARCKNIIKLAEDDPRFAAKIGAQLERAWELADIGDEQERENQEKIDVLRQEVAELNRNINTAMRIEGQGTLRELQQLKNDLERQRDAANAEANKYRSNLNDLFAKRQELFDKLSGLEEKEQLLDKEWAAQVEATERETTRRERLAEETTEVKEKLEHKAAQLHDVERSLQNIATKLTDAEKAVKEQRSVNENADREAEFSFQRIEKLRSEVESHMNAVEKLTVDAYRHQQELKAKEQEISQLRRELSRGMRQKTSILKKCVILKQGMTTLEAERETLKNKVATLEKDLERAQKDLEQNKKRVDTLDKQRGLLNRNLKRAAALTSEHETQAMTHQNAVKNIENALHVYHSEINFQRDQIARLEKERDFFSLEASKLAQQVVFRLIEIKKLDAAVLQYRKKLAGLDSDLKKMQQIYHLAESDKAVFERTLRDAIAEIKDNFSRIKLMRNQVSALRNQVNQKDEIIHQEALRYDRIIKETDFFTKHASRIKRLAEDLLRQVEALQFERSSLSCSVAEFDGELGKHDYYANNATSRRRVYQRQIMECEKALREVWDKWRVLHSTIRIGAYHYRNMIREIKIRRCEILEKRKLQADIVQTTKNYSRMRREVAVLENCIAKEKCMINAIVVQIQHPINVHRWRLLEVMNPEAYEMVVRINLLTKRLVTRTCELKRQSSDLKEKQAMYVEVRKSLERSPGLELGEEIVYYQNLIVAKKHQYQCLRHELKTAESQVAHYRQQVQDLNDKMMDLKRMYFRRLEAAARQKKEIPLESCKSPHSKPKANRILTHRVKSDELLPEDFDFPPVVEA